jgi:hypothetical protein
MVHPPRRQLLPLLFLVDPRAGASGLLTACARPAADAAPARPAPPRSSSTTIGFACHLPNTRSTGCGDLLLGPHPEGRLSADRVKRGGACVKPDLQTRTPYDLVADQYDTLVRRDRLIHSMVLPPLLELVGPVAGKPRLRSGARPPRCRTPDRRSGRSGGRGRSLRAHAGHRPALRARGAPGDSVPAGGRPPPGPAGSGQLRRRPVHPGPHRYPRAAAGDGRGDRLHPAPRGVLVYALPHPCFQAPGSGWYQAEEQQTVALVRGSFQEGAWSLDRQFSGRPGGLSPHALHPAQHADPGRTRL